MSLSYYVPVPAIRGHFGNGRGGLQTFQTQVPPDQVINLLGHDPRPQNWKRLAPDLLEIYENVQRKTDRSRLDSVEGYLDDRLLGFPTPGAFPAICIGMTNPADFEEGDKLPDVGTFKLDLSPQNTRIVLDGLGRLSGCLAFIDDRPDAKDLFSLPTTIFAPQQGHGRLTPAELGQLFFDFNFRAKPISRSHAMKLDQSDPYLRLTNDLGARGVIAQHGGMETGRQSLGSKSTALVVQAVLLRFVRGACEGAKFQKANNATVADPYLTRENLMQARDNLDWFLGTLAEAMGPDEFRDRQSVHLTSAGWQALGLTAHDLFVRNRDLGSTDRERVCREVAGLDWSRSNKELVEIGVLSEVAGVVGLSGRGAAAVEALHDYIRDNTSLGSITAPTAAAA